VDVFWHTVYTHILFFDHTYGRTMTTFVEYLLMQFGNAALLCWHFDNQIRKCWNPL